MMFGERFSTTTILNVFTDEIESRGGRVTEAISDGRRLYVRSLLPYVKNVRPKDRHQGGVGMRATENELWLHPYLLREVCRNGAVMAHSLASHHLEQLDLYPSESAALLLSEAIADCSAESVFSESIHIVQRSLESPADYMLNMLPHLRYLQQPGMERFIAPVLKHFFGSGDSSRYALMNAVTATARDERNPMKRWRLEELGGAIGAGIVPIRRPSAPGRKNLPPEPVPVA
jgi:hypothetical protein